MWKLEGTNLADPYPLLVLVDLIVHVKCNLLLRTRILRAASVAFAVRLVPSTGLPKDPLELGGWVLGLGEGRKVDGMCADAVKSWSFEG